jgi:hypothetical protein
MIATIEIRMYPLTGKYKQKVIEFYSTYKET